VVSLAVLHFNLDPNAGDKLFILDPDSCSNAAAASPNSTSSNSSNSSSYLTGWLSPGKILALGQPALAIHYYSPVGDSAHSHPSERGFSLFATFTKNTKHATTKVNDDLPTIINNRCMKKILEHQVDFVQTCGSDYATSSGIIQSPTDTGIHHCVWNIQAPLAKRLRIIVEMKENKIASKDRLFVLQSDCQSLDKEDQEILEGGVYLINDNAFSVYFCNENGMPSTDFRIFWTTI
jgi:hypothetical protein